MPGLQIQVEAAQRPVLCVCQLVLLDALGPGLS